MPNIKSGKFTSANAALNLELGFLPDWGFVFNTTDVKVFFYEEGMTADYAFKIETGSTANAYITSGGFTAYTGGSPTLSSGTTPGASKGITLGTTIQDGTDVCFYIFGENS